MATCPGTTVARTISNTAYVDWTNGSQTGRAASNRIDLDFNSQVPLQVLLPTDGLVPSGALAASCGTSSSADPSVVTALVQRGLTPASSVLAGRSIILSLNDPLSNKDSQHQEYVTGTVQTSSGDREAVTFTESGPNTGTFLAVLQTGPLPPSPVQGDCHLSTAAGSTMTIIFQNSSAGNPVSSSPITILADPLGVAFDSRTAAPVGGVKVTIIDTRSGQPATVYGDDGASIYPSTVITGQSVADSGGTVYTYAAGNYRFPLVAPGTYRLEVEPVSPYTFPSTFSAAELSGLRRPDGQPFQLTGASYGDVFTIAAASSVRNDLPLDRPVTPLVIAKTVSRPDAQSGDLLVYQISIRNPGPLATGIIVVQDRIPSQMRYRPGSSRLNGAFLQDPLSASDRGLRFSVNPLGPGEQEVLRYVLEVRPNARSGDALNEAQASADGTFSNISDAVVRIHNDDLADRLTLIGRVLGGGCFSDTSTLRGVPGIRLILEDGSYAVTDRDGRYHFEGLRPGTHVVQIDRGTIPQGAQAVDCENDVRSGGRPNSRFIDGLGGELKRADFHLAPSSDARAYRPSSTPVIAASKSEPVLTDVAAAGGNIDWLAGQHAGIDFLFPGSDFNPRSPVTRVVVKHLAGQKATLFVDSKAVEPIAFEGVRKSAGGDVAVSSWRGIPLAKRSTNLRVDIRDGSGALVKTLQRTVVFSNAPAHVELIPERSVLLADGVHRPVLALKITDRGGRPVHQGMTGVFELPEPYYPAMEADAQQARQLAGLDRARPAWHVSGDDGIAYVELEPTTASGTVSMRFSLQDGQSVREERLEAWLSPGDRPWTIVGLAEGSFGFNRLDKHLEKLGPDSSKDLVEGRLALYAKGRILGRWLLTLSYDSSKHRRDETFGGVIDPQQYYTIYADRSERRYDAASLRKLYIRLERPQFYALFGDYNTAIDEPVLARYVRSFNGAKAEYGSRRLSAKAFVADSPLSHRREEIQGNGLSGPYALKSHFILANSEQITLQTRDRFRSEVIVEERILSRHVDYDIDYIRGTLIFRSPVLSRSSALDPQFIIAEYDVDGAARTVVNAGARVTWRDGNQRLQMGATVIHDNDGTTSTNLIGGDVKIRVTPTTELRGEAAVSRSEFQSGGHSPTVGAWLMEVEHHDGKLDLLAYAGERQIGFGVGQTNQVENGTRKFGLDLRWHANDNLSVTASTWRHIMLADGARSDAARVLSEYRRGDLSGRLGLTLAHDELADGRSTHSTLLNFGASKRFANGRLELGFESEIPVGKSDGTINFPSRESLTARYAVNRWATLIASYEIAKGHAVDARTARIGFDLAPWAGARIALSGNVQDIPEYGPRTFAALGLAQSIILSKHWSVDFSLDSNKTVGGIDPSRVVAPMQPVASGGFLGGNSKLIEDFTAVTAGATYRSGRLSITGRAEYRDGEREDRTGLIIGAIRQVGEGRGLAGAFNWFRATGADGSVSSVADGSLTWANRPGASSFTWLDKLEIRRDQVINATSTSTDVLGNPLAVVGNLRSLRVINSLTMNYSIPSNRLELSLFWGARYASERFGNDDIAGLSSLLAADARVSIGRTVELGAAGTVRYGVSARSAAFSAGPQVSFRPAANSWVMLGYNLSGYGDRDFAADRFTRGGFYATLRVKFDELSFASLGLGR